MPIVKKLNQEVKIIIDDLKNGTLEIFDIPQEYEDNYEIIDTCRQLGLLKIGHKGFDVIEQEFFVEEWLYSQKPNDSFSRCRKYVFNDFADYFDFLGGDIYEDACYYQCQFATNEIIKYELNLEKLNKRKCFETKNINDYSIEPSKEEIDYFNEVENAKKLLKNG